MEESNVKIEKSEKKNDKIEIEKVNCRDLQNKFLLVKVGTNDKPATQEQIDEVEDKLEEMFEKNGINCLTLVTHHAVTIDIIEKRAI